MAVRSEILLLAAAVIVLAVLVLTRMLAFGKHAEAMTGGKIPPGEVRDVLQSRALRQVGMDTSKPKLWIHLSTDPSIPFPNGTELTSPNFGATAFDKVPSIEKLCAFSVIAHNSKNFNIILVTDDDLPLLLPGWNTNMQALPEAAQRHTRDVAMLRVLYYYGGFLVPATYGATAPLTNVFSSPSLLPNDMLAAFQAPVIDAKMKRAFAPSVRFVYSAPLNKTLRRLVDELTVHTGTEAQVAAFHDTGAKAMERLMQEGKVRVWSGKLVGTQDVEGNAVSLSEAIHGFKRASGSVGVWIPARLYEIRKYGWMMRDAPGQILAGSTWFAAQLRG
jgi:hypothetical protein